MNVGQIKASMGDQKAEASTPKDPNEAIKKQLQQDGLKQAVEFAQKQSSSVTVSSTQTVIGLKVYSTNMNQNVVVDGKRAPEDKATLEEKNASLFDFEEVAKNVMRFVGGVIQSAADSGADDDKLNSLFSQARDGVSRGIAMAEKDLAGMMNDEISEGIASSRDLIEERLSSLENRIFNPLSAVSESVSTSVNASDEKSGGLLVRTKDGDEVTITFENVQQLSIGAQSTQSINQSEQDGETSSSLTQESSAYFQMYERSGISFSVQGELDEGELDAIADLVGNTKDLADTFFSGDLDKAFDQALNLGFDDTELVGYALQLNRATSAEVVKTYENIQHYNDDNADQNKYGNVVSPISQYLDKMLATYDQAEMVLASGEDYNNMIADLLAEMKDVQVPDLVSAINRFHTFNQKLLDGMPNQQDNA
ncbi:DUF5610 domain-containing protein [Alteromonas sp. KUL49]|uniref:DUF5610 domain-containing protein n=1 Tax=Alteromonas sp. KUL49 TaxID=2480798 RepID=UPI00102EDD06|nr:DUF5610 domain-containing protein [Alteromonas sp. KUL49]TAP33349.1 DUF4367 domain-containing protein [Alteromonas sp. KUL49]GEA13726.1 hypothetical protein KUL49_41010 [Alteromonas sp. KUL49]